MFCKSCETQLNDGASFCTTCGAQVDGTQQAYSTTPSVQQPTLPMGWFKFIINFSLFAGAVLNVIYFVMYISGAHYEGEADLFYAFFPSLRSLDIFMAFACILLAVYAVITRFQLAKFRKIGPMMLYILPAANVVLQIIYAVGVINLLSDLMPANEAVNFSRLASNIVGIIVFEIVNVIYFSKRKHMFIL